MASHAPPQRGIARATSFALALAALCSVGGCDDSPVQPGPLTAGELYLEEALDYLENHSLHRFEIDWPTLRRNARAAVGHIETPSDAYPAIRRALDLVGDKHSAFLTPADTAGQQQVVNQRPDLRLVADLDGVADRFGYIRVPEAIGKDIEELAVAYHHGIENLDSAGVCGWIVDLRRNRGGSMWPMVAGLGPILGEGTLGYYVHPDSTRHPWSYENGASKLNGATVVQVEQPYVLREPDSPVAILVDQFTASSAEATFISFVGRPRTRSVGARTAGFSTSNRAFVLSDGAILLVTTSVMADRTGHTYGSRIWPDTLAGGDRSLDPGTDQSFRIALEWLGDRAGCALP